ncbi:YceI family protein [Aquirhabdus sp.]|uniref:YceI family protein n=1 Tax=Aquirhabdus sp. TaxID=2824160 RepID=UPI00396CB213
MKNPKTIFSKQLILKMGFIASFVLSPALAFSADWQIDASKTLIRFTTAGIMKVDGGFDHLEGQIKGDAFDPAHMETTISVQANSISTGSGMRDDILKGNSFFNVEKYPVITFKSTQVTLIDPAHALVHGDLTMIGVTKPIEFAMTLEKPKFDAASKIVTINTKANLTVNRNDWGMDSYSAMVDKNISVHVESALVSSNVSPTTLSRIAAQ